MCTLSFIPVEGGFHLLMNRDEQRSRITALPPRLHPCGNLRAIYPSEQGGGTWIGVNEAGLCAALLNWYSKPPLADRPAFSRGLISPTLLAAQKDPEKYRDLVVRIAGYCAYFVELTPMQQAEILARTEEGA